MIAEESRIDLALAHLQSSACDVGTAHGLQFLHSILLAEVVQGVRDLVKHVEQVFAIVLHT